jgi:hypothetical protein
MAALTAHRSSPAHAQMACVTAVRGKHCAHDMQCSNAIPSSLHAAAMLGKHISNATNWVTRVRPAGQTPKGHIDPLTGRDLDWLDIGWMLSRCAGEAGSRVLVQHCMLSCCLTEATGDCKSSKHTTMVLSSRLGSKQAVTPTCAGVCDDVVGNCYCDSTHTPYKPPPPPSKDHPYGTPPVSPGKPLSRFGCQPTSVSESGVEWRSAAVLTWTLCNMADHHQQHVLLQPDNELCTCSSGGPEPVS